MKLISVITVVRNNKVGFEYTARSIVNQTADKRLYEWVVIDGASTDGTQDVIRNYTEYICYYVSEPDCGVYDAMNKAIQNSEGDYLIFMNSGDSFSDNHILETVLCSDYIGKYDFLIGNSYDILPNGKKQIDVIPDQITASLLFKRNLGHQSVFIKRNNFYSATGQFTGYDTSYKIMADAKHFFENIVLNNASVVHTNLVISNYDTTGISSINSFNNEREKTRFLSEALPLRIYNDLNETINGKDALTKICLKLEAYPCLRKILTVAAKAIYLPVFLRNRIKMALK